MLVVPEWTRAGKNMAKLPKHFCDPCVIYPAAEDGMWVAHSLNTDQLAQGDCVLHAYVELKRVMRAFIAEVNETPDIEVFTPAPREVWKMFAEAKPLPQSMVDRAEEIIERRHRRGSFRKPQKASIDIGELVEA